MTVTADVSGLDGGGAGAALRPQSQTRRRSKQNCAGDWAVSADAATSTKATSRPNFLATETVTSGITDMNDNPPYGSTLLNPKEIITPGGRPIVSQLALVPRYCRR